MSDHEQPEKGGLVTAKSREVARRPSNLVARGLADLAHAVGETVQLDPKNAEFYFNRGVTRLEEGDYDNAIKDFDEVARLDPKNAIVYVERGWAWCCNKHVDKGTKDFNETIRRFDEAIRLNPNNAFAYRYRAKAWWSKANSPGGKVDEDRDEDYYHKAMDDFDEAIRLDPDNAIVYAERGWSCKDEDQAIKDFGEAIRLDPTNALFREARGIAWTYKHKTHKQRSVYKAEYEYDKAIKDFDEAIRLDPKKALAYGCRGLAWHRKKQYERAIADYEEAIRLDPKDAFSYRMLGSLLATSPEERVRDGKRAIQMATKACELTGWKNGLELDTLAAAYAEAGQFEEALRFQKKALEDRHGWITFRERLELYERKKPFREMN